jgi:hypothetical protein
MMAARVLILLLSFPVVCGVLSLAGCADPQSQRELDLSAEYVRSSLEAWSQGTSADVLAARPAPIEFHDDDWQQGARLVGFEIVKTDRGTDGRPRCLVKLDVRLPDSDHETQREVTYEVNTAPKIVITRAPNS